MKPALGSSDSFTVISGLAHQLDSPLKTILARTRKLINDYKNRDFEFIAYKDFKLIITTLEQLECQLQHCSRTTERVLSAGKRQARLEENNCFANAIIKTVVRDLNQQLKSGRVQLVLRLGKNLPVLALGPVECHQITHNVISNAIQAMPSGGVVRVKTFLDKTQKFIGIQVADQGVGIAADHLPKIFEPFFTTKERGLGKSAGLGLSITHSIVNASGGSMNIKSSLRKGTVVTLLLPVYRLS